MTRVILLCAGRQRRFEGWDMPKQLLQVHGEPVLDRTIRQLRENGLNDIIVAAHDPRLKRSETAFFSPPRHRWLAETLLSTRELWHGRTILLLGDVLFSDSAIASIIKDEGSPRFIGRPGPNRYTMCPWSELFGVTFSESAHNHMVSIAKQGIAHGLDGGPGKLSCVYSAHLDLPPQAMQHGDRPADPVHFLVVDDWTDDMDFALEYENMLRLYEVLGSEITSPTDLIADTHGVSIYLDRAEWLLAKGFRRWAEVGFSSVLKLYPDDVRAKSGLAALEQIVDPLITEDETFWDQWQPVDGIPHPASRPAMLGLDRIGPQRLVAIRQALHRLAGEGADWAGATGRTLYRVLTQQPVTDTDMLALAYVLTHAMNHEGDLANMKLDYPA